VVASHGWCCIEHVQEGPIDDVGRVSRRLS